MHGPTWPSRKAYRLCPHLSRMDSFWGFGQFILVMGLKEESIWKKYSCTYIALMHCSSAAVKCLCVCTFVWFRPMIANSSTVICPSPFKSVRSKSSRAGAHSISLSWLTSTSSVMSCEQSLQQGMFPIDGNVWDTSCFRCEPTRRLSSRGSYLKNAQTFAQAF